MMRRWWYVGLGVLLAVFVAGGVLYYGTNWALAEQAPEAPKGAMGLLQGGTAHGWLGLSLGQLNSDLASRLGLSRTEGVVVMAVVAGSPAEAAGFQNKDVIISVAGNNVSAPADVVKAVREAAVGSTVQFGVARGNQSLTLTATIAAELGEAAVKSEHYQVLFIIGILLFSITFVVNLTADLVVRGIRRR